MANQLSRAWAERVRRKCQLPAQSFISASEPVPLEPLDLKWFTNPVKSSLLAGACMDIIYYPWRTRRSPSFQRAIGRLWLYQIYYPEGGEMLRIKPILLHARILNGIGCTLNGWQKTRSAASNSTVHFSTVLLFGVDWYNQKCQAIEYILLRHVPSRILHLHPIIEGGTILPYRIDSPVWDQRHWRHSCVLDPDHYRI